jgi:hypothetical protein
MSEDNCTVEDLMQDATIRETNYSLSNHFTKFEKTLTARLLEESKR